MPFLLLWGVDVLAGDPAAISDNGDGDGKVVSREKSRLSTVKPLCFP